ncbi:M23 family metallopeptidase [Enterovibrio calviensis]|uniref:M23 family metallopeptidase n=1 Tax=Enterovibrio calviensis TaxID=91359 RepID=UPI000686D0CC|nr:M23 family metallopeptidase [Enterovibrio calviensis]
MPKDIIIPKEQRSESLFEGSYPTQRKAKALKGYAGEYRGYYPPSGGLDWRPKSSQRGGRNEGKHNGVDIYTGYGPFPVETPILSATDGKLTLIFDDQKPNALGNRAAIVTTLNGKELHFRYGHLSRFARGSGDVKKGEIIGYAGCTGNADTKGECSEDGPCGITSCHVHLTIALNGSFTKENTPDPIPILGWKLDYKNGSHAKCGDISGLKWVPPRPAGRLIAWGVLKHQRERTPSGRQKRKPLAAPFQYIAFDDTRRLLHAVAAYQNLQSRIANQKTTHHAAESKRKTTFGDDLKKYMRDVWRGKIDAPMRALQPQRVSHTRVLDTLGKEIQDIRSNNTTPLGGSVTRALLVGAHALGYLMGGASIRAGMSNRRLRDLGTKKLPVPTKSSLPSCGLGVNGHAILVATDQAQVAFHIATLKGSLPHGPSSSKKEQDITAVSLDFGTTSGMQAIWPLDLTTILGPSVEERDNSRAEKFCQRIKACVLLFYTAYSHAYRHSASLSLSQDDSTLHRRELAKSKTLDALTKLQRGLQQIYQDFFAPASVQNTQTRLDDADLDIILTGLLELNQSLLSAAVKRSRETEREDQPLISPRLYFLKLLIDKDAENSQ